MRKKGRIVGIKPPKERSYTDTGADKVEFRTEQFSPSNRELHIQRMEKIFAKCIKIARKKNADYTEQTDDPFANFRDPSLREWIGQNTGTYRLEQLDDTILGITVRLGDKAARRKNIMYTGNTNVSEESQMDTILDEINYLAILASYMISKKEVKSLI